MIGWSGQRSLIGVCLYWWPRQVRVERGRELEPERGAQRVHVAERLVQLLHGALTDELCECEGGQRG